MWVAWLADGTGNACHQGFLLHLPQRYCWLLLLPCCVYCRPQGLIWSWRTKRVVDKNRGDSVSVNIDCEAFPGRRGSSSIASSKGPFLQIQPHHGRVDKTPENTSFQIPDNPSFTRTTTGISIRMKAYRCSCLLISPRISPDTCPAQKSQPPGKSPAYIIARTARRGSKSKAWEDRKGISLSCCSPAPSSSLSFP